MIRIHVLVRCTSPDIRFFTLPYEGQNVEAIVDLLGVDRTDIGMIVANGRPVRLDDHIEDTSEIYILPGLEGG